MKKKILTLVIFIGVFLIQIFFNEYIEILGVKPDLILITLLISALYVSPVFLIFLGFVFGLMQDWLMLTPLIGLSPLLKTILVFIVVKILQKFKSLQNILLFTIELLLIFFYFIIFNFISLLGVGLSFNEVFVNYCLPEFIYSGILFIGFYYLAFYYKKNRE
ncbi:MAG: rod shape-determining protein MreD [Candidatus Marinimicrobia bacterium]|nr:rod shape-determining protein MreD [Candidatus Neomarinimicrobiota bacterium]